MKHSSCSNAPKPCAHCTVIPSQTPIPLHSRTAQAWRLNESPIATVQGHPPLFAAASHLTRFIIPHCDQKKLDMVKTNPNLVSESLRSVARVVLLAHVLISVLCRQAFARYKRMLEQNDNKGLAVCTAASSFTWRCFTLAQDTSAACDAALSVLDATPSPSCKVGRTCAQSHPASCPPPPHPCASAHAVHSLSQRYRDAGPICEAPLTGVVLQLVSSIR